jgi:peptidyl-tRNA hydrolase, PTH1 family
VSAVGSGRIAGRRVLLVKPLTFMNNSGVAVKRLSRYYKVGD